MYRGVITWVKPWVKARNIYLFAKRQFTLDTGESAKNIANLNTHTRYLHTRIFNLVTEITIILIIQN